MAGLAVASAVVVELWRMHLANAIGYDTVPVERGPIQASVTASGTLKAVVDVQVGSQVSGNIKALYADVNTKVKKGQLVAEIDPEIFQTQVDKGAAALASMHSATLTASAQVEKAKSELAGTIASEKAAESVPASSRSGKDTEGRRTEQIAARIGERGGWQ
jgi:HlyD family secretion protein